MESMGHGGVALIVTWTCVYTCAFFIICVKAECMALLFTACSLECFQHLYDIP